MEVQCVRSHGRQELLNATINWGRREPTKKKMAKLTLSQGASWVVERLPDAVYDKLKHDIEFLIEREILRVGYDMGIRQAFNEEKPATLERK